MNPLVDLHTTPISQNLYDSKVVAWFLLITTIDEYWFYLRRPYRMTVPCAINARPPTVILIFPYHPFNHYFRFNIHSNSIVISHKCIYNITNVISLCCREHASNRTLYASPTRGHQRIQQIYCCTSIYVVTLEAQYSQEETYFHYGQMRFNWYPSNGGKWDRVYSVLG